LDAWLTLAEHCSAATKQSEFPKQLLACSMVVPSNKACRGTETSESHCAWLVAVSREQE
jgi:hypothetical protein